MTILAAVPVDHRYQGVAAECHRARPGLPCAGYEERHPAPTPVRVLASSTVRLLVGVGDPIVARGATAASVVTGPHDVPVDVVLTGLQRGVALRSGPLAAYALLGVPMHRLGDGVVDLEAVLGRALVRLTEQAAEAGCWSRRVAVVRAGLAALRAAGPTPDPGLVWAWRRLHTTGGAVRVGALAADLGWSTRHLTRKFREQIGVTPKTAARIVRFERAAALLGTPHRGLAAVAADSGYADHAHLSREVRALARWTPTELARGLRAAGDDPDDHPDHVAGQGVSRSFKPGPRVPA